MKRRLTISAVLVLAACASCSPAAPPAPKSAGGPEPEARVEEKPREVVIGDFVFPWSEKPAPATEFRAQTADGMLHFAFVVADADVIVADNWQGESTLDGEDRVELFFAKDNDLADYWCLEIDPLGRVHDYHAQHYRKFDDTWNCPDLAVKGNRTETGYKVTGSVPLKTLADLLGRDVKSGTTLRAGFFRAEFYGADKSTHGESPDNWLSWVRPTSAEPDFHTPSALADWVVP